MQQSKTIAGQAVRGTTRTAFCFGAAKVLTGANVQHEYFITANSPQFIKLVQVIQSELHAIGRDVISIKRGRPQNYVTATRDGKTKVIRGESLPNADIEIFIRAESEAYKNKGISVIVKDWNGAFSKLILQFRHAEALELVKDTWQIFEEQIKEKGWKLIPTPNARGKRELQIKLRGTPYDLHLSFKRIADRWLASFDTHILVPLKPNQITVNSNPIRYILQDPAQETNSFLLRGLGFVDPSELSQKDADALSQLMMQTGYMCVTQDLAFLTLQKGALENSTLLFISTPKETSWSKMERLWHEIVYPNLVTEGWAESPRPQQPAHKHSKIQAKLMPRKRYEFLECNANASEVATVLFGGDNNIRKMEIVGAQCAGEFELDCRTSLSINTVLSSDYVVFISVTIREIESMETGREELLYLLWDREVAEIKIKQERAGLCRVELLIDENENKWKSHLSAIPKHIPFEQDQDWYINRDIGKVLIVGCWQKLKEEWVNHETAKRDAGAPKNGKPQTGRRQDPINLWAIEQIREGHNRGEVEKEYWQKRRQTEGDAKIDSITDPHDLFKKNVLDKV